MTRGRNPAVPRLGEFARSVTSPVCNILACHPRTILYKDRHHGRAPVAQLDRAPDYESGGREFESSPARHSSADTPENLGFCSAGPGRSRGGPCPARCQFEAAGSKDPRDRAPAKGPCARSTCRRIPVPASGTARQPATDPPATDPESPFHAVRPVPQGAVSPGQTEAGGLRCCGHAAAGSRLALPARLPVICRGAREADDRNMIRPWKTSDLSGSGKPAR